MSNLTTTQQVDLKTWLDHKDPASQPLPDSLKNVLIERCLEEVYKRNYNNYLDDRLSIIGHSFFKNHYTIEINNDINYFTLPLNECSHEIQIYIIQTFLSRTPDGQAVMPFLDVETQEFKREVAKMCKGEISCSYNDSEARIQFVKRYLEEEKKIIRTLQEKLSFGFWKATSMQAKAFDQALETITKTYLLHFYV